LAKGIQDWEEAAKIIGFNFENNGDNQGQTLLSKPSAPYYLENALYGRKWMVKLILLLAADDCTSPNEDDSAIMESRQTLLKEQTQTLITVFLEKESNMDNITSVNSKEDVMVGACLAGELGHITQVVSELLDGFNDFEDKKLFKLTWLCPILSSLIQSNNKAVRVTVHLLVSRMFEGPLSVRN